MVDSQYSTKQLTALVILRMLVGWHFLFEGVTKLLNPGWSAQGYLMGSQWIFEDLFKSLAGNSTLMGIVDFLNVWGLILIGLSLILGLLTRPAAISGMVLLGLYFLANPPMVGVTAPAQSEGSYIFVNKNLIEIGVLWVLAQFPTSQEVGLERLIRLLRGQTAEGAVTSQSDK